MQKIAVIGAGVSGLTVGRFLQNRYQITVFEKESAPGGLIRCKRVDGSLYHICGGHVFNSKRNDVLDWFWSLFDKESEFIKAERNSVVFMEDNCPIPYPVENHIYLFDEERQKSIIDDMIHIAKTDNLVPNNFEEFLKYRFGGYLYELYFKPYNEKVWRRDLKNVPLSWLEGKLPMPTVAEMIFNNINHVKEKQFVHSTFWYEKQNGSQYIANRLAEGLDIRYGSSISEMEYKDGVWHMGGECFDKVVFCGNIKDVPTMLKGIDMAGYASQIEGLEYHGTTSVFCEIDRNPYSWIYQPSRLHDSHRIICTGNFSESNNADGKMTATIEFTDEKSLDAITDNLSRIPLHPKYLAHHYNEYTYPIQDAHTREMLAGLKNKMQSYHFYFVGRFADWEYYNMDAAMAVAMDLCKRI